MVDLRTRRGDGGVSVSVDPFGTFGLNSNTGDFNGAFYDPIGNINEARTVYESNVAIRVGVSGGRNFLADSEGASSSFTEVTDTIAISTFSIAGLNFQLTQTVEDLFEQGERVGSELVQTYTITNPSSTNIDFEILRYLDGDLAFDGTINDSGGRLLRNGQEILFETDSGENPLIATTFVGITANGGSATSPGRFEIDEYSELRSRIIDGTALDGTITGDSADADEFIDGGPYDLALALRNSFVLNSGASTSYTTTTIFGSGSPQFFETVSDNVADTITDAKDLGILIGTRTLNDFVGGTDANDYFRFELTDNSQFKLLFKNLTEAANVAILDDQGVQVASVAAGSGQDGAVNLDRLESGVYYLRVFRFASKSTSYGLEVEATPIPEPFQIRSVTPAGGSNAGQSTLTISGNQFTPQATVSLISNAGVERAATNVVWLDDETLSATFDLTGLAADAFDVRVTDTAGSVTANDAFGVRVGTIGQVEVYLSTPSAIRPTGTDVVTITYHNTGDTDVVAPLLSLEATGALLQESGESDFSASQIQFLGINNEGLAGVLPAGATGSFTVDFKPTTTVGNSINFSVKAIAEDEIVNWAGLKDSLRPSYISPEGWDAIYNNFTASVGTTAGEYQATLAKNANLLSQAGEYVSDASRLLTSEIQQASNYQSLSQRYSLGAFGRGGSFIGDIRLVADVAGNVTIENSGIQRFFERQTDGSYRGQDGDEGNLTLQNGTYRLQEQDGTITTFRADGRLNFVEDTNGNRVTASYAGDRLTRLDSTNGDTLTFTYNAQGRISTVTDQAGRTTTYGYDASGELLTSVTDATGTTQYDYNSKLLSSVTDPNGTQIQYEYDAQGRLIRESLNGGAEALTYTYDANGGVTITDTNGATVKQLLNDRGQVTQYQDALGRTVQFRYDNEGNLTRIIQPNNSITGFTYDDRGNLLSQVNSLGQQTAFTYESTFDQLQSVTDARGNAVNYEYDNESNLSSITYADGSSERFSYDDRGNVTQSINRRIQTSTYTYDSQDQLLRQNNPDGSSTQYTYDARGNLTSATNAQGTIAMVYDSADRLQRITYPSGRFLEYSYDAGDRRTRVVDQSGNAVNYGYDAAGRLSGLTDENNSLIVSYTYDGAGQLIRENNGNGTYTTYTYDTTGQVKNIVNYTANNSVNSRFDYTYDSLGRRTGANTQDGQWSYTYDAIGQLTSAVFNSTNPGIASQNLTYVYDAAGNRIRTIINGVTTEYTTNNLNQYTNAGAATYQYNADGNITFKTEGGNTWTYTYDSDNRLIRVDESNGNQTEYQYDALGNRIATLYNGQRTEYVVDPFGLGDVVGEYDASGNRIASYTHGLGLISRTDSSNVAAYYDADAIGSTVGVTGAAGNYLNRYVYQPFGAELFESETLANPFEYVGQFGVMEDPNGFDFMRARFYDSATGRFSSTDPLGIAGGDTNFYRYAFNNPIKYSDPSGNVVFIPVLIAAGTGALVGAASDALIQGGLIAAGLQDRFNWSSLGVAAGLGAVGGGATAFARNTISGSGLLSRVGNQFSHSIPTRTGWAPEWLINWRRYPIGQLNGEFVSPKLHYAIDPRATGGSVLGGGSVRRGFDWARFPRWRQIINRIPSWLWASSIGGALGGAVERLWDSLTGEELDNALTNVVNSFDPNDIIGPAGFGAEGWIATPQLLPYTIRFENDETKATAPAVQVAITHQLDADLNLETFALGDFGFGSIVVEVPDGLQSYSERLDLRRTIGAFVDVEAKLDRTTRTVTWTLKTIDPATGELATGVDDGFLPPNNANGDGEGFVRYRVEPKTGLQTGDRIDAQASIVFDTNAPIATPVVFNTIDMGAPTSTTRVIPTGKLGRMLNVKMAGTDNGSGIASYDIYVSTDNQPFERWLNDGTNPSAKFLTKLGHTYRFASAAKDNVGHLQPIPTTFGKDLIRVGTNRKNRLRGGVGNDGLIGLGGADQLIGKAGKDILNSGGGKDKLFGGRGGDTLIGGKSFDIFVLEKGADRDLIRDFKNGQDRLELGQGLKFDNLDILQKGRNTLIKQGSDSLALLQGVRADQITIANFT